MPGGQDTGGQYVLHLQPEGDLLAASRDCEAEVFGQRYGNTPEELAQEYADYEGRTTFLALTDPTGDVVGVARLQVGGGLPLKTLVDITRPPWNLDASRVAAAADLDESDTWEVLTLGVRPGAGSRGRRGTRSNSHHAMMVHGILKVLDLNRVGAFVAVLDERVRALQGGMGLIYSTLPGATTQPYLGSPASTPVFVSVASFLDVQRRQAPEAYRLITLGYGLEDLRPVRASELMLTAIRPQVDLRSRTAPTQVPSAARAGNGQLAVRQS